MCSFLGWSAPVLDVVAVPYILFFRVLSSLEFGVLFFPLVSKSLILLIFLYIKPCLFKLYLLFKTHLAND